MKFCRKFIAPLFVVISMRDMALASESVERRLQQFIYPHMGMCRSPETKAMRCAYQASQCAPTHISGEKQLGGEIWINSYELMRTYKLKVSELCQCSEATPVGFCAKKNDDGTLGYHCATNVFMCDDPETFVVDSTMPDGTKCSCSHVLPYDMNEGDAEMMTKYGACGTRRGGKYIPEESFCAISPHDCEEGGGAYRWRWPDQAEELFGYPCTCDLVYVGGCRGSESMHCAINEKGCGGGSRFSGNHYSPPELLWKFNMKCRLCSPIENTENHVDKLYNPNKDALERIAAARAMEGAYVKPQSDQPAIIGMSVAVGVLTMGLIIFSVIIWKKSKE